MSEVLLDSSLDHQQRDYTTNINRSANSLKAIISDILDLSKIEAKKMTISNSAFDLSLLLNDIIEMFKVTTKKKGLTFQNISIIDEEDHLVIGDQGRVRQILTNLMGNAFKFTSEGYIRMTTMRDTDPDPDKVKIRFIVEDSGVGISDEALEKIFVPFSQADHTSARFGGTGLGLSISKEVYSTYYPPTAPLLLIV
ncbi:Phytochrome [Dactylella cylindrospora]|nr:Phytochrome [Dactylella cylindrospora]